MGRIMPEPPMVRTSERKAFRNCQQAWFWSFREGLVTKGRPASQLWFGSGIHLALAEWYGEGFTRGPHPVKTFRDWLGDEIDQIKASPELGINGQYDEPQYIEAGELGVSMLNAYLEKYGEDPDLEVLAVEQPFEIELVLDGKVIAIFAGTFDGVAIDHSERKPRAYLLEHKTAANIATAFLALDDQAGGYFSVATIVLRSQGILGPRQHIAGVLYNYLRKTAPDDRERNEGGAYLNKNGEVSKRQPPPAFHREVIERNPAEVQAQLIRLSREVELMNEIRDGRREPIKNTNWMCPKCQFFEMCVLDEKGLDIRQFKRAAYTTRDPYEDHRKSAAE